MTRSPWTHLAPKGVCKELAFGDPLVGSLAYHSLLALGLFSRLPNFPAFAFVNMFLTP